VPASRLAIDLSGGTLRVLEGVPGGPMRCGEAAAPPGALERGRVLDAPALGQALRQLLARSEITATRALIAASDAIASFRVAVFPKDTSDEAIDAAVRSQLPGGSQRMALRQVEVRTGRDERAIYAAVWDRSLVQAIAEATRHAGLEPLVVDLKSLCVARAIEARSCILLDLTADAHEVVLIDEHVPRLWHTFKVDGNADLARSLASGLKPVLAFYARLPGSSEFGPDSPILVRSEQALPSLMASRLERLSGHSVLPLPPPARVPPEVRFTPYLTCIGLVMRRRV
jgi:hypothetical protein